MSRNIESATITFDKATFNWIEDNRGNKGRSEFVRGLVYEKMNREQTKKPTKAGTR